MSRKCIAGSQRLIALMVFLALCWSSAIHPAHVMGQESPVLPEKSVDHWIELLGSKDDEVSFRAVDALVALGPSAVPGLADVLGHENVLVSARSALALGRIGKQAIPKLKECLRSKRPKIRQHAIRALGGMTGESEMVVPMLTACFPNEPNTDVREAIADALSAFGSRARSAVPVLTETLADPSDSVRSRAACALRNIGLDADVNLAPLAAIAHAREQKEDVRIQILSAIATAGERALPELVRALKSDLPALRENAARDIAMLGVKAEAALPALTELAKSEAPGLRAVALYAIDQTAPKPEVHLLLFISALNDPGRDVRRSAIRALERLGAKANSALPVLRKLVDDADPIVRDEAREAITSIEE